MTESPLSSQKSLEQSSKIVKNIVIHLSYLLEIWEENNKDIATIVMDTQTRENLEPQNKDLLRILVTRINSANVTDQNQFLCFNQFDVEELETYLQVR